MTIPKSTALNDSETKSVSQTPIISLDPESGAMFFLRREIVREWSMKRAIFALPSKPGLYPESGNSPRTINRQTVFWKKGVSRSGFA